MNTEPWTPLPKIVWVYEPHQKGKYTNLQYDGEISARWVGGEKDGEIRYRCNMELALDNPINYIKSISAKSWVKEDELKQAFKESGLI